MTDNRQLLKMLLANPQAHALVKHLDEVFPEATPHPGTDIRQIDVDIGKREVVRYLQTLQEEEYENILGA